MYRGKRNTIILLMLSGLFAAPSLLSAEPIQCKVGPIEKMFGETKWVVNSCDDGKSIVLVSAPGNPAMPFYFMITEKDGKLAIHGEGNGSKEASSAAGRDLETLIASEGAVAALIAETKTANESEASE